MSGLNIQNLTELAGREIRVLSRRDVEEQAEDLILLKAKSGKVGFLVPGDPMVATTHIDLRLRAHKAGIKTRIVHAASVISAVAGVTGLQSYKFGRTVTVPVSWRGEFPESVYASIMNNLASGLHTLVLLEVDIENQKHVAITDALKEILVFSERRSKGEVASQTLVVAVARLEAPDMLVKAGAISELTPVDFGNPPYALIFPGPLHFMEAEALHAFCGARSELVSLKS
jgi:diphthine synthase